MTGSIQLIEPVATPGMPHIDDLLRSLVKEDGSDLHLKVGRPPLFRQHGRMQEMPHPAITDDDMAVFLKSVLNEERQTIFQEQREIDLAYSVAGLARFRVNSFHQNGHAGAVFRVIPFEIKNFEQLKLPPVVKELCELKRGMILVTGPTGSGKSTTLAAMIDYLNETKNYHIITIEDPIEFLHKDKSSVVNQRELGADTHTFGAALKHILRQTPDVILVGEMRDLETIGLAITAAETGHLVFGTLHTTDAAQTIDRIIDVFPPEEQAQIRLQLSTTLESVISQTLLATADGHGRVAAHEILVCHSGIKNMIREGKSHQLYTAIQMGGDYGMKLLDTALKELVMNGVATFEEAVAKSSNPTEFARACGQT